MFLKNKKYILDGGMGQTLLAKGLKPEGTLWSATALINESYHELVVDTHLDFIKAGAELIVTNNFAVRKMRFIENNSLEYLEQATRTAGKLAKSARDLSNKLILVAGSLPTQGNTYQSEIFENENDLHKSFNDTAKILEPYVDLYYLDVLCSVKEIKIVLQAIKEFSKPILIGLHFRKSGLLPSNESVSDVNKVIKNFNCCGLLAACVSPEIVELVLTDFQNQNLPYGFKVNAFENIPEDFIIDPVSSPQPTSVLGVRKNFNPNAFKDFVSKTIKQGASLLGGCCEIKPQHIESLKSISLESC
jgi:homocysteine S-methyltransferase